jgi:hypothetical protein
MMMNKRKLNLTTLMQICSVKVLIILNLLLLR